MLSTASTLRRFSRRCADHHPYSFRNIPTRTMPNYNSRGMSTTTIPSWATFDPYSAGNGGDVYAVPNLVDGAWSHDSKHKMSIIDPLDKNKGPIFTICDTQEDEVDHFIQSLRKVSKSGLHNPLKNPDRYLKYGDITRKVGMIKSVLLLMSISSTVQPSDTFFPGRSCTHGP